MYSKTKKIILSAIIIAALQLLIFSGISFSSIVGSGHDLTPSGPGQFMFDSDEICVFCHTPHNAIVVDSDSNRLPLWNRSISGNEAGFTVYSSSSLNAAPEQPRSMTLLCMSCHDGTSALNVVQNYKGVPYTFPTFNPGVDPEKIDDIPNLAINIGESVKDLSNDHPVSFVFDSTLRDADKAGSVFGLNDPSTISPLRLFNSRLECATCHNPHEQGTQGLAGSTYPFLRMSNDSSDMCLKCHNK